MSGVARLGGGQGRGRTTSSVPTGQPDDDGRVTLRAAASGDEAEFLALSRASASLLHPWMSLPATPEDFRAYLRRYERPGEESLLICLRGTGAIVGLVNINSIVRGRFQCGSLSYAAFAPQARGT